MDLDFEKLTALLIVAGAVVAHLGTAWRRDHNGVVALVALDAVLLILGFGYLEEDTWNAWMREDAWVEWVTFFAFVFAGVAFLRGARKSGGVSRFAGVGLGLFCLFVGAEEISWGQRLFTFEPPEIFLEANYQQEFNLHNLLKDKELGPLDLDSRYLVALIALLYGLIGPLLPLIPRLGAHLRPLCPSPALMPAFAAVIWFELVYPVHLAGEAAECFFGLIYLVDATLRYGRPVATGSLVAGTVALGVITVPILDTVVYGSDEERSLQAREELSLLGKDMLTALTDRIEKKGRVHKRMFTADQSGYIEFGLESRFLEGQASAADEEAAEPRTDRKGYLLDPWNNAYWLLSSDNGEEVLLYSFGPNRRRDTNTRPFERLGGDDVGVLVQR